MHGTNMPYPYNNLYLVQLKQDAVVSHSLSLINNGLSTVSVKLSTDENHFRVTPAIRGGSEFTTLHPSDSIHVSSLSLSLSHPRVHKFVIYMA